MLAHLLMNIQIRGKCIPDAKIGQNHVVGAFQFIQRTKSDIDLAVHR